MRPRGGDGMGGTDGSPRLGAVGYSAPAVSGEPRIADRFGRRRALPARWPGGQIWLHRGEGRPSISPLWQCLPLLGRELDRLGGRLRGAHVTTAFLPFSLLTRTAEPHLSHSCSSLRAFGRER